MGTTATGAMETTDFELVFKEYYEGLCHYANMVLKDMDHAEEVVQSTFVRIWEKKALVNIEGSVKSYLYRAVHNSSLNEIKHKKVREKYFEMQKQDEPISEMHSEGQLKELEKRIEEALQRLPEQCGLIFRMSRYRHLKYREIADILGISVKTVENQMGKALKLMRMNLADYLGVILLLFHLIIDYLK